MTLYALDDRVPVIADPARVFIAPGARVIGNVTLGLDVSVWFNAVLRGDNDPITVGDETNIQDLCMLHADPGIPLTIGRGVTVGHRAILHGCAIGDETLIGMGATVLNGAKIGKGSLVGAGALVTEGKEFPDHVLIVGAPARVARELDVAALERLAQAKLGYVRNGKRFAAGMRKIGPDSA